MRPIDLTEHPSASYDRPKIPPTVLGGHPVDAPAKSTRAINDGGGRVVSREKFMALVIRGARVFHANSSVRERTVSRKNFRGEVLIVQEEEK